MYYIFIGSVYTLAALIYYKSYCLYEYCSMMTSIASVLFIIIAVFLDVLFGLFVLIMFFDQISCITDNTNSKSIPSV